MPRFPLLFLALLTLACNDAEGDLRVPREAPPAAAVVAPGLELESLEHQLRQLEGELERAQAGEPQRLLNAEAITDRLVHAERSVDWLGSGYDVQARLRQLQSMADRIVAQLRRGASLESVDGDITLIRTAVQDLQRQLEAPGGGGAPPTLDSLLAQDPMRDAEAPSVRSVRAAQDSAESERDSLPDIEPRVAPVRSGPLGSPVPDSTPGG